MPRLWLWPEVAQFKKTIYLPILMALESEILVKDSEESFARISDSSAVRGPGPFLPALEKFFKKFFLKFQEKSAWGQSRSSLEIQA